MKRTGNASEVLDAFVEGRPMHTPSAPVPGGYRLSSVNEDDRTVLYSYRTQVAVRLSDGRVAVTPRKYSVTTSKMLGRLRSRFGKPTGEVIPVTTNVPGRWGGYGFPWHPTGFETLPFEVLS